jgi:hypothetical protein
MVRPQYHWFFLMARATCLFFLTAFFRHFTQTVFTFVNSRIP